MKRSEILKIIEGLFELAPNHSNDVNAENLLATLEDKGMLPPLRDIEVKAPATTWYYEGHEWDNEDER